jgi:hypothetical protein
MKSKWHQETDSNAERRRYCTFIRRRVSQRESATRDYKHVDVQKFNVRKIIIDGVENHKRYELGQRVQCHKFEKRKRSD